MADPTDAPRRRRLAQRHARHIAALTTATTLGIAPSLTASITANAIQPSIACSPQAPSTQPDKDTPTPSTPPDPTATPTTPTTTPTTQPTPGTPTTPANDPKTNVIGGNALANKGTILNLPTGTPPPPPLHACAWVIADLNTGDIIAAHDPHSRFLPASTLKTLTALTVIDKLDPNQEIEGSGEDMAVDGTKVGIEKNATYPISALLQALMLSSANDAANALARANGGMDITTEQMNKLAAHLGAKDTHAMNTSGLDAKGQVTSAYDLALIGRAAVSHPKLAPLLTLKGAHFPAGAPKPGQQRKSIEIGSHNRLLWNYQGTIGIKNGYTVAARHTYIGAARRGDKAYVISYLSSFDGHWRSSAAMLDWAFNHGSKARPIGRLVNPGELDAPPPNKEKPTPPKGKPTTPKGGSNKPDNAKDTPITSAQDASPVAATSFHGHTSLPTNLALALSGLATLAATGALILHRRH